jgi:hypothetical protein
MFVQHSRFLFMYPIRALSINNGWDLLSNQKKEEWQDIRDTLEYFTAEVIQNPDLALSKLFDESEEDHSTGMYSVHLLPDLWGFKIEKYGWESRTASSENSAISLELNSVKNKVSSQLLTSNEFGGEGLDSLLSIIIPRAKKYNICDISVLLIASDSVAELLPAGNKRIDITDLFLETECRAYLSEFFPFKIDEPVLIIFFSQNYQELVIEELPSIQRNSNFIERAIEFPPEYYQAGVTVLANFGEILRDKYPSINAKVRIEQEGNIVRMHVGLPNGEVDTVEEVLEKYFLVVSKQAPVESLFESRLKVAKLENKLDLVDAEIRSSERVLKLSIENREEMKAAHEQDVLGFRQIISEQATQIKTLIHLAAQQAASHEKVQLAQISHTSTLFKDLVGEAHGNQATQMAINSLRHDLMSGIALIDVQDQISSALATIKQEKPSLLGHIAGQVESAGFGAVGGYVLDWITKHPL